MEMAIRTSSSRIAATAPAPTTSLQQRQHDVFDAKLRRRLDESATTITAEDFKRWPIIWRSTHCDCGQSRVQRRAEKALPPHAPPRSVRRRRRSGCTKPPTSMEMVGSISLQSTMSTTVRRSILVSGRDIFDKNELGDLLPRRTLSLWRRQGDGKVDISSATSKPSSIIYFNEGNE